MAMGKEDKWMDIPDIKKCGGFTFRLGPPSSETFAAADDAAEHPHSSRPPSVEAASLAYGGRAPAASEAATVTILRAPLPLSTPVLDRESIELGDEPRDSPLRDRF